MKHIKNTIAAVRKNESPKLATAKQVTPRYSFGAGSATTDVIRG